MNTDLDKRDTLLDVADDYDLSTAFSVLLRRDLLLSLRYKSAWLNPLLFIFIVIALFALGIGPTANHLSESAPGIVWVIALLAILLSLDSVFKSDFDDGSLEQMLLSPQSMYLAVLAKVVAHWLLTGFPIVIAAPIFSAMLSIPSYAIPLLCLGLFLGTGILTFIGAIGASLTVGLRNNQLLMALIVFAFVCAGDYFW